MSIHLQPIPVLHTRLHDRFKTAVLLAGMIVLVISLGSGARAAWIYSKAIVAQMFLDQSWQLSLLAEHPQKPWSWADMSTIARIDVPTLNESLIVLSDASGESMAFGPGLVAGDPLQATQGTIAIGGHRDTHLSFLEHLPIGAEIHMENAAGELHRYQINDKTVVDSDYEALRISRTQPGLVLITCYPFNATQTGGSLRLVARARKVDAQSAILLP